MSSHINLFNARADDLGRLYLACKPAEFNWNRENILDRSYRKAGKMDLIPFPIPLDTHSLRI